MKRTHLSLFAVAVVGLGLTACESATSTLFTLYSDSTATADVAVSSGDAIASSVNDMKDNELFNALPGSVAPPMAGIGTANAVSYSRTRTCYDAAGAVVANCSPLTSVRKIVTHVVLDGSRTGSNSTTGGGTATWTGAVHRVSNDTLVRNFNTAQPPIETSRTHTDLTVAHDTSTFTNDNLSRIVSESARDSVKGVTFNLPRSTNPWPVSGSIVRVDSVHAVVTREARTETRDLVRTITVAFPPDAQGNVVLTINGKTCNLNLVTHAVTNCH